MPAGASGPHRGGYWPPSARSAVPKSKIRWLPRLRILSYDVDEILGAAHEYFEATGRRVSIEYALIRDINDQAHRAQLLADRLIAHGGAHWIHVNPIPLNPVKGSKWTASDPMVEKKFVETLRDNGISATIRDTRGSDIDGACGQLAAEVIETDEHRADREARVARVEAVASRPE
ncbi:hypothetical protein JOD52_000758 [Brachybacterium muris]|nr:hypothetical protein [Brachybacterium muris]